MSLPISGYFNDPLLKVLDDAGKWMDVGRGLSPG